MKLGTIYTGIGGWTYEPWRGGALIDRLSGRSKGK
jgi:uncharacterized protein YecE (DUF72 family)